VTPPAPPLNEELVVPAVLRAPRDAIVVLLTGLGLAAALIHVEAAFDHLHEYALYTPAFVLLAAAQAVWALKLLRHPSRLWLLAGLVLAVGVILLWAASRTTGIPIAPVPWKPETIEPVDAAATLDEITTALAIGLLLATDDHPERWPRWGRHVGPVLGIVFGLTLLLAVGGGHAS
jgi:hypothetical protein